MERCVDFFRDHHHREREAEGTHQRDHEQFCAVGGRRHGVRKGRVEHPELLALLPLLHILRELRFFVALQQCLVELSRAVVIPRQLPELLLAPRHVLDAGLIGGDPVAKPLLLALVHLDVRVDVAERLFQPEHIRGEGSLRSRRRFVLGSPLLRLGGFELALEDLNFGRRPDDVGVLLAELEPKPHQLLLQADQTRFGRFRRGPHDGGRREGYGQQGFGFRELTGQ